MDLLTRTVTFDEVIEGFAEAAMRNEIDEESFPERLEESAELAHVEPEHILEEVSARIEKGHYNEIMIGSLPEWIRPHFGIAA